MNTCSNVHNPSRWQLLMELGKVSKRSLELKVHCNWITPIRCCRSKRTNSNAWHLVGHSAWRRARWSLISRDLASFFAKAGCFVTSLMNIGRFTSVKKNKLQTLDFFLGVACVPFFLSGILDEALHFLLCLAMRD